MTKGNSKGLRWRVRRHMRHPNQHRLRSFCCYAVDVWIRGAWQECLGGYPNAKAARVDAKRGWGSEKQEQAGGVK